MLMFVDGAHFLWAAGGPAKCREVIIIERREDASLKEMENRIRGDTRRESSHGQPLTLGWVKQQTATGLVQAQAVGLYAMGTVS